MQVHIVVNFDTEEISVCEIGKMSILEALEKTPSNGASYIFEVGDEMFKHLQTLNYDSMDEVINSFSPESEIASTCNLEFD